MPIRGLGDTTLDALRAESLAWLGPRVDWVDAHTHIGRNDPDGMSCEPEELLAHLADHGLRALVFPMHEPGGYAAANREVLDVAARSDGRLRCLVRVTPHDGARAVDELRAGLEAGAAGLKMHPRSDGFALDHPGVAPLVEEVAAHRGVLLFHAGRGIPALGARAVEMAERFPELSIVLAHAGISDLDLLPEAAARLPNLLFDTSWWQVGDLLQLLCTIPPGRILYASDLPYGPTPTAQLLFLRTAREAGLPPEAVREMAGAQLERVLAGQPPADLGPAPGIGGLGPRVPALERVVAYASAAVQLAYRGADVVEALALARLACQGQAADGPLATRLRIVDAYLVAAQGALAAAGPMACVEAAMGAALVAGTPQTPAVAP
jgi:uncharacterized protein